LALALVAVGCQNYDDQFDSLNADIAALTTKVNGLDAGVAAQVTAVAASVANLATQVTALGNSALTTTDLTTALAGVLTNIATVQSELTALDSSVATSIAGVNTNVAALTTQLTAVQTSALTSADVAALDEVTNLNAEMTAVQAALDELLAAQASVNGNVSITNQAELDYVETLIETDGTPANYIINGNLTITANVAANYDTGYIAAISALTGKIASVIGAVAITTADTDAAIDISQLTYVSGALAITGKMPSGFSVSTAASLALDVEEADITLASLTSAAGGVTIDITGTTTITNVAIANLTNGAVTTSANTLALSLADVDLGAGHPATTTTVKSLIAGNATNALTGATLTITGALTLGSKVVTDTTIDAGGAVTLSSGVAGSSVGSSTITSGGDINIAALTLGAASASALAITTDGGAGGSITLGATTSGATFTATASGSTVNAASWHTNGAGTATLAGSAVTLTGLATNTGALVVNTATALSLPALAKSAGTITAAAATSFSAPLLTTEANVDIAAAATFAAKALGAVGHWVDIATGTSLTLTAQDADLDLSAAVHMVTLDYTGAAVSAAASEDTDLTYAVYTSASSLTTVSLNGGMGDVIIKAPLVTGLSTAAGSTVRTLTTSGTALTSISFGHQGYNGGAQSAISVVDTKITSLDMNAMKWLGILTVSGNTSLTAITMPTATAAADNVNVAVAGANVSVTIIRNALVGAWTAATAATSSSLYTEGSFSTAPGITNAKAWLNALLANVVIANASVTYEIEIDDADAAMETNKGVSVAINGTSRIDTAAELALLPN
jgi:hypothetical protein